ncbi:MAG: RNA polymerase sigma factor (sigma-70 family), partial [Candidatus Paceibacteria bacterium]
MTITEPTLRIEELLQHSDWVNSLAHKLVVDSASADDLVQDTWVVALRRPPTHAQNLRGWLGRVVTSLAQSTWRAESRRGAREQATARHEAMPSTEQLVHEASMSRELVDGVLGLSEPFKTVLLLRYFRDMTPTEIAQELGRPLPTVKTQLQRGIEKLRDCFDETYVDRDSWCTALLPLALAGAPVVATMVPLIPAAAALIGLTMAAGVGIKSFSGPALAPQDVFAMEGLTPPALDVQSDGETEDSESEWGENHQPAGPTRAGFEPEGITAVHGLGMSLATGDRLLLKGRLITEHENGLDGVRVQWVDPGALHWTDETKTVISGPGIWLPLAESTLKSFAQDSAAIDQFAVANFVRPQVAAAFLRGEPTPRLEAITRAGGEFELELPQEGHGIETLDEQWGVLGTAQLMEEPERRVWVAGMRHNYIGEVLNEDLEPVPFLSMTVVSQAPAAMLNRLSEGSEYETVRHLGQSDEAAEVHLGSIALSRKFSVLLALDGEQVEVEIDLTGVELGEVVRFQIQVPATEVPQVVLVGRVYLPDGKPAARAIVTLGDAISRTDSAGLYELELFDLEGDLAAARAGSGVIVMSDAGAAFEGLRGIQSGPDLRLPADSSRIAGRIVDHNNAPIPGARVSLVGGLPISGMPYCLEDLAGGRTWGSVESDALGGFSLKGLL